MTARLYATEVMADAPNIYVPMTERSGAVVYDQGGRGRHGTIVGGVTPATNPCPAGGGMTFNGSTGVIQFASFHPEGTNPSAYWIEFWAKSAASPVGIYDTAPDTEHVLRNYPAGSAEWWNNAPVVALTGYVLGDWNHVMVRNNFTSPDRGVDIYVNGAWVNSGFTATSMGVNWNTLRLGNINNGSAGWFSGSIAQFAVYRGGTGGSTSALVNSAVAGTDATILARVQAHYQAGIRAQVSY